MKSTLALIIFCSISIICVGQQKIIPKSFTIDSSLFNNIKHYRLINKNAVSTVITLKLDNMPCLVTNNKFISPIPNAIPKSEVFENMPNATPKSEVFENIPNALKPN